MNDESMIVDQIEHEVLTVYEVSYLLLPNLSSENADSESIEIKNSIISLGGSFISGESPILLSLAYPMVKIIGTDRIKCGSGYFGWLKFELLQSEVSAVKKFLDNHNQIIRSLIITTVKENTLLNGKMKLKSEDKGKVVSETAGGSSEETIEKEEMTTEELDKTIDDLVIA